MNGIVTCTDTSIITVTPPGPWWQAKDGDITTSGDITSFIPNTATNSQLVLDGDGGFPGVPLFGGSLSLGFGTVSSKNWEANTTYAAGYTNYEILARQIPSTVTFNTIANQSIEGTDLTSGGTATNGYYWYKYDGGVSGLDLTIASNITLGTRKVVLLVENADIYLNGNVSLTDGSGFMAVLVGEQSDGTKGNIYINPTVTDLEGIFLSDNAFLTGAGTTQLTIRGSVAALGGISMQRNLTDNSNTPSEYFEFAPDQLLLFPPQLNTKQYNWKEVSP
jgi:hypothetical protein